ncbi:hypothetical protein LXL04_026533 [Taraxacum kok-saghyz]
MNAELHPLGIIEVELNSWIASTKSCLIKSQHPFMNSMLKPSGPGDFSRPQSQTAFLISSSEKDNGTTGDVVTREHSIFAIRYPFFCQVFRRKSVAYSTMDGSNEESSATGIKEAVIGGPEEEVGDRRSRDLLNNSYLSETRELPRFSAHSYIHKPLLLSKTRLRDPQNAQNDYNLLK